MSREAYAPPDPARWQCQYLRLIAFPLASQVTAAQNWWERLTGVERDSSVTRKQQREDVGTFDGTTLSLLIDPLRIQWTAMAPVVQLEDRPGGFPVIGSFLQRKQWFCELMNKWMSVAPPINRLAFAGLFLLPVERPEAAPDTLNCYLRAVDVGPTEGDFLYRINRRRPSDSGVPGLEINPLRTWSVLKLIQKMGTPEEIVSRGGQSSEITACALELDINTVPTEGQLGQERLSALFTELVEVGVRIATTGDDR